MGYAQRNFMTPLPEVDSYTELDALLERACRENLHRQVRGKEAPVLELWEEEKAKLLLLPPKDFAACVSYPVKPNGYSSSGSLKENFGLQSGPCRTRSYNNLTSLFSPTTVRHAPVYYAP